MGFWRETDLGAEDLAEEREPDEDRAEDRGFEEDLADEREFEDLAEDRELEDLADERELEDLAEDRELEDLAEDLELEDLELAFEPEDRELERDIDRELDEDLEEARFDEPRLCCCEDLEIVLSLESVAALASTTVWGAAMSAPRASAISGRTTAFFICRSFMSCLLCDVANLK